MDRCKLVEKSTSEFIVDSDSLICCRQCSAEIENFEIELFIGNSLPSAEDGVRGRDRWDRGLLPGDEIKLFPQEIDSGEIL